MITFVVPMAKLFTLLFSVVFFFFGCTRDENRGSRIEDRQSRIEGPVVEPVETADVPFDKFRDHQHPVSRIQHPESSTQYPVSSIQHPASRIDTAVIRKMRQLEREGLEIDFREPLNKTYFFNPLENPEFSSMILLSHDRSIRINLDNDILDNTDRYYTNGIRFDFISPVLKQSPLSWLMVPYWGAGINYYGISIGQNMYTPFTTKVGGIHYGDRPYAAYLVFSSFKITNDPVKKFRQTSEIGLGVIGPLSFGDFVQKSFHTSVPTNNEPLGWEYQVQNDVILNYSLVYEKGIISERRVELNLNGSGNLGTLYTNMGGGFQFRAGLMNPFFSSYGYSRSKFSRAKGYSKFQAFVYVTSLGKLVGYDATLEGGMFNRSSVYTLKSNELCAFTYQGTLGITLAYEGVRFDLEQFLLSPEFHGGGWHKWIHIGITFGI